ncbi:metallophosphoesterase [uncultured Fusobacterium sp.]|uniref:metallophosphoesterase n=1 Tax=uncultured Fusobacterium sp. TaxID=159267 RepID=UPI000BBAF531|nr:metallophosphoesterase [uncultured Fusobacterium sp.]BBA52732.1 metallophosphoesterase [Fusobacterium varium]
MNYFFLGLSAMLFAFCLFVMKKTVKYVFSSDKKIFIIVLFLMMTILLYGYQFFNSYFVNNFSYTINRILSYIVYYYLAFVIYGAMIYFLVSIIEMIFRYKLNFNLYKPAFIIIFIILGIGTFYKHNTVITEYEIDSMGEISVPMNIVLVSDVHLGYINENTSLVKMIDKINSLKPDVVLIAGDLIDMYLEPVLEKNMLNELKNIKSTYGTFFTLGNHDIYGRKAAILTETLRNDAGTIVLRDEKILLNNEIYIAGRDNFSQKPIKEILAGKDDKPVILIQHTPDTVDETIENEVFLQVSGHTHKGQMFPGRIFTKKIFKIDYGHEKIENTNIIVSSGYGTWGPPIRIGSQSEIVIIKIK